MSAVLASLSTTLELLAVATALCTASKAFTLSATSRYRLGRVCLLYICGFLFFHHLLPSDLPLPVQLQEPLCCHKPSDRIPSQLLQIHSLSSSYFSTLFPCRAQLFMGCYYSSTIVYDMQYTKVTKNKQERIYMPLSIAFSLLISYCSSMICCWI